VIVTTPDTPVFYPGQTAITSPLYTTMQAACLTGFTQIQASSPQWATATTTWDGTHCLVLLSGQVIGTLQIYSSYAIPQTQTVELDAYRDDGHIDLPPASVPRISSSSPG